MKCLLLLVALAAGASATCVHAQHASSLAQSARRFAQCTKALDADCVVRLSDADRYNQLRSPDAIDFAVAQRQAFASLKRFGNRYIRFDIEAPWTAFAKLRTTYAFVPYVQELEGFPALRTYLIAISEDDGKSWKFFDGSHVTPENIQAIIPGYAEEPLPPVSSR